MAQTDTYQNQLSDNYYCGPTCFPRINRDDTHQPIADDEGPTVEVDQKIDEKDERVKVSNYLALGFLVPMTNVT